jgi:hypothetical protein
MSWDEWLAELRPYLPHGVTVTWQSGTWQSG